MSLLTTIDSFRNLGCADDGKCAESCRVFLDLKKRANISNLQCLFDAEINEFILYGKKNEEDALWMPKLASQSLSMDIIDKVQEKFPTVTRFWITMSDGASNLVYYEIINGLGAKQDIDLPVFEAANAATPKRKSEEELENAAKRKLVETENDGMSTDTDMEE